MCDTSAGSAGEGSSYTRADYDYHLGGYGPLTEYQGLLALAHEKLSECRADMKRLLNWSKMHWATRLTTSVMMVLEDLVSEMDAIREQQAAERTRLVRAE